MLEDNESDAELIELRLKKSRLAFVSKCVKTKSSFAKELASFSPDIVLADYSLPQFDGRTALALLRENFPEIPFIMISGKIGDDFAAEILRQGATDYILKDRLERLGAAVERAILESEQRNVTKELRQKTEELEKQVEDMRERELRVLKLRRELQELRNRLAESE